MQGAYPCRRAPRMFQFQRSHALAARCHANFVVVPLVGNAAALVWDTLYGVDDKLQPQRQMVESEEISADGLTWTFRLRTGLKFHDGEPVLAKDAVASLARWAVRDPMGQMLIAIQQELSAIDDRTFKWVLKKPYPKMLVALGKNNTPVAFIMPE